MNTRAKSKGFTLIELMIVMAIIGIIGSIAYSSYTGQVDRGRRAEAKDFIFELASAQETFYAQNLSYANSITAANQLNRDTGSVGGRFTASLDVEPPGCEAGVVACRTYTLTLTPNVPNLICETLTLDNTGVRGNTGTGTVEECWR